MSKSSFKAPQKALRSSWRDECFSKPKTAGTIIKRSLGLRATPIGKLNGSFLDSNTNKDAYQY
jgi:hypothetical protein